MGGETPPTARPRRGSRLYYGLPLVALLLLFVLLLAGLRLDPKLVPSPLIGQPVPTFDLSRLTATDARLTNADLGGGAVLFNVWASWCVSCRIEHPLLQELAATGQATIYGLNYKDERAAALQWLTVHGNPYTASGWDRDGRIGIELGVYGVPETYVVADGIIRYKHVGPLDTAVWETKIKPLLRAGATL